MKTGAKRKAAARRQSKGWPNGDPGRTREKLLAAARDLFSTVGYFATDTNKIARKAGFAPATFYKHFPDKREVFLEVYRQWVAAEWEMLGRASKESGGRAFTRKALRLVLEHHCKWAVFRRDLRNLAATDPEVREARFEQRRGQHILLREMMTGRAAKAMTTGELVFLQAAVEKVCDTIADGETEALGATPEALFEELERFVGERIAITPRRPRPRS
jgi:AcrR family transcriptional regulator